MNVSFVFSSLIVTLRMKQLKPATYECREAKGECDLAEYCDGVDPLCPSDVYRRNTDKCTVIGVCQRSVLTLFTIAY